MSLLYRLSSLFVIFLFSAGILNLTSPVQDVSHAPSHANDWDITLESGAANSVCHEQLTGKIRIVSAANVWQCYGWVDLRDYRGNNVGRVYGLHLPEPGASRAGFSCRVASGVTRLCSLFDPGGKSIGVVTESIIGALGLGGILSYT